MTRLRTWYPPPGGPAQEITARPREDAMDPDDEPEEYAPRGRPEDWRPARKVRFGNPGRAGNQPPCIDDDVDGDIDAAPASYPAWLPGETFVVSGPVGPRGEGPGTRFGTRKEARAHCREKYGAVLEWFDVARRWAFRVPMPGPAGAKHRPKKGGA